MLQYKINISLAVCCSSLYRVENIFFLVALLATKLFSFSTFLLPRFVFVAENIAIKYIFFFIFIYEYFSKSFKISNLDFF